MPDAVRAPHALARPSLLGGAFLAAACAGLVCVPAWLGARSPFSLALLAAAVLPVAVVLLARSPGALVWLVPAMLATPMLVYTYVWELALALLFALVLLHAHRTRATWRFQCSAADLWLVAFTAWAVGSVFWSEDARTYAIHFRRVLLGLVTWWIASRLPHLVSRRTYEYGLLAAALSVGFAGMLRRATSGFSDTQALLRRPEVTNLGWGTANFLATLLLLLGPFAFATALESRGARRAVAWVTFVLVAVMQVVIASRAAATLFVLGTLAQLLVVGRRARWAVVATIAVLAATLASPMGSGFFSRFSDLREFGSMTIRIWYWREGWLRLVSHLPFGMGLGQGYAQADKLRDIDPHNYWLVVGGELGVVGLVLWIGFLVTVWRAIDRLATVTPAMRFALRLAFVTAQVHTIVEPTFQGTQYQFAWFRLFGGMLAFGATGTEVARSAYADAVAAELAPARASSRR